MPSRVVADPAVPPRGPLPRRPPTSWQTEESFVERKGAFFEWCCCVCHAGDPSHLNRLSDCRCTIDLLAHLQCQLEIPPAVEVEEASFPKSILLLQRRLRLRNRALPCHRRRPSRTRSVVYRWRLPVPVVVPPRRVVFRMRNVNYARLFLSGSLELTFVRNTTCKYFDS